MNPMVYSQCNTANFGELMTLEYAEFAQNALLALGFMIPSLVILFKYETFMDSFTRGMIVVYNIGFIGNILPINLYI